MFGFPSYEAGSSPTEVLLQHTVGYRGMTMVNILAIAGSSSKYKLPDATPAGFWAGLWHGIIAPLLFWISLFSLAFAYKKPIRKAVDTTSDFYLAWARGHHILKLATPCKTLRTKSFKQAQSAPIYPAVGGLIIGDPSYLIISSMCMNPSLLT
jgi:hypothetical protein